MTMKLRTVVSHPHSFRLHPSPFVVAPSACGYAFPVQKRKVPACEGGLGGQRGRRNDTPNRRGSPRSWIWQGKGPHGPGVTGHVPRCVASIVGTLRAKNLPIAWLERPGQDLNLRGVTQRFSRPPPYRTRRPGQRVILRQMSRIIVPTYAVAGEHLNPEASSTERCTSPRKSTPAGGRLLSNSVPRRAVSTCCGPFDSPRTHTFCSGVMDRFPRTQPCRTASGSA